MAENLHYVIYSSLKNVPSNAQIVAGLDADNNTAIASGGESVPVNSGAFLFSPDASGLTPGTSYRVAIVWYNGTDYSNVIESNQFTTNLNLNQTYTFIDDDLFFNHSSNTSESLSQPAVFFNYQTWLSHNVNQSIPLQHLAQLRRFDNNQQQFNHSIQVGDVDLIQFVKLDNNQSWFLHSTYQAGAPRVLAQQGIFANNNQWFNHEIHRTFPSQKLTQTSIFQNASVWLHHDIQQHYPVQIISQDGLFQNTQTWYRHSVINPGALITVYQTTTFNNIQQWFPHEIVQASDAIVMAQLNRFDNTQYWPHHLIVFNQIVIQDVKFNNTQLWYRHSSSPTDEKTYLWDRTINLLNHDFKVNIS